MKLYEAPRNCKVRILADTKTPPFSRAAPEVGEVLEFHHVDGMYSLCKTESGAWCHPLSTTEIEIVSQETLDKKENI